MIKYVLRQDKITGSKSYNKWFAVPAVEETTDSEALARHMEQHNSGSSEAMCLGVMKSMVRCIKEMILDGKNVKINDLTISSCGIRNAHGADSEDKFTTAEDILSVRLRTRATGDLRASSLDLDANVRRASTIATMAKTAGGTAVPAPARSRHTSIRLLIMRLLTFIPSRVRRRQLLSRAINPRFT